MIDKDLLLGGIQETILEIQAATGHPLNQVEARLVSLAFTNGATYAMMEVKRMLSGTQVPTDAAPATAVAEGTGDTLNNVSPSAEGAD